MSFLTGDPQEFEPWLIISRTVMAFITLFVAEKFLGKKAIAQLTPFDFIATITLGSLAAGLSFHIEKNPLNIMLSIISYSIFALLVGLVSSKNKHLKKILLGDATVVIQNGKILEKNMDKAGYSLDTLNESLREKGIFNIEQVENAIVERNGKLSVQKKSQNRSLEPSDLNISTKYEGLAIEVIMDGQILDKNLIANNINKDWLISSLTKKGINDLKDVFYACLSTKGTLYIDNRNDHTITEHK